MVLDQLGTKLLTCREATSRWLITEILSLHIVQAINKL